MNILILCLSDPSRTPRPKRIIDLMQDLGHNVDVAGYPCQYPLEYRRFLEIKQPDTNFFVRVVRKVARSFQLFYKNAPVLSAINQILWGTRKLHEELQQAGGYDYIFVEDLQLLPLVLRIKNHAKIILDAREYYPEEIAGSLIWSLFDSPYKQYICQNYLKECDHVLTVSPGLQALYKKNFDIDCTLFMSVPNHYDTEPRLSENTEKIHMVHHGLANKDRCLETMIDVFDSLDERYSLDFYLTGNYSYIESLKVRAQKHPNITFHNPVPFSEILPMLCQYDIGFYLLKQTGLNTTYALPNKLFEFIQARLAIVSGPSPDMANIITRHECGFVSDDFAPANMAEMLNELTLDDINIAKRASNKAARELCFENESFKLTDLMNNETQKGNPLDVA